MFKIQTTGPTRQFYLSKTNQDGNVGPLKRTMAKQYASVGSRSNGAPSCPTRNRARGLISERGDQHGGGAQRRGRRGRWRGRRMVVGRLLVHSEQMATRERLEVRQDAKTSWSSACSDELKLVRGGEGK
jgi:hypothetical protein